MNSPFTIKQKNKLLSIMKVLEDIYYNGKMHKLTQVEAEILSNCYNEIVKSSSHTTETFNTSVAEVFRKAKFHVVDPHDCEVKYVISLD